MARDVFAPWAQIVPGVGPMTADELLYMRDDGWQDELVSGVLVRMPPHEYGQGVVTIELLAALANHLDARPSGELVVGVGYALSEPGEPDTVLAPDISYLRAERAPHRGDPDFEKYPGLAPDLAVEVSYSEQTRSGLKDKAKLYLRAGARLVWVVWPEARTVDVWRPGDGDAPGRTLALGDALDGLDVVPGFAYPLADLFA